MNLKLDGRKYSDLGGSLANHKGEPEFVPLTKVSLHQKKQHVLDQVSYLCVMIRKVSPWCKIQWTLNVVMFIKFTYHWSKINRNTPFLPNAFTFTVSNSFQ